MTLFTADVSTSIVTMPPLTRRGESGNPVAIETLYLLLLPRLGDQGVNLTFPDNLACRHEDGTIGANYRRCGNDLNRQLLALPFRDSSLDAPDPPDPFFGNDL